MVRFLGYAVLRSLYAFMALAAIWGSAGLLLLLAGRGPASAEEVASPRLGALRREVETGGPAALERFWRRGAEEGTPLAEPVAGEGSERLVTLLWRGGGETRNGLVGASPSRPASAGGIHEGPPGPVPGTGG